MNQVFWLDDPILWASLSPTLEKQKRVAVDLEGDFMLHRYGRRICLFQLAFSNGDIWLIDALAGLDLSFLYRMFDNPTILKVFWGASNDVKVLKSLAGCSPRGLVDLWEAAKILLTPRPSLSFVLAQVLQVNVMKDPDLQVSDWNLRPLSDAQLAYAAQDVRFLLPLWGEWESLLKESPQGTIFQKRIQTLEAQEVKAIEEPWTRVKGWYTLSPSEQSRLKNLVQIREAEAKRLDLAPWRVVKNETLLEWALSGHEWTLEN